MRGHAEATFLRYVTFFFYPLACHDLQTLIRNKLSSWALLWALILSNNYSIIIMTEESSGSLNLTKEFIFCLNDKNSNDVTLHGRLQIAS